MPIRPENRARYPENWKAISLAIRARAGNVCEQCRAPNGAMIRRGRGNDAQYYWIDGEVRCAENGDIIVLDMAPDGDWAAPVKVILTVAHLDHTPENCDPANLKALCQRCHNRYDAKMRAAGIKARRRSQAAAGELFP
jgi:hypothetical protein